MGVAVSVGEPIEVRASAPAVSEAEVFRAFDALKPGECLALLLGGPADEWLSAFQRARKGEFEWTPLPEKAGATRVEVLRRAAERGALRLVNEALSWDHDRLDALEARAFEARSESKLALAAELIADFAFGLRRHIRFEEELLFPEFEARFGFSPEMGPTAVMRAEHREILDLLGQIEAGIGDAGSPVEGQRGALHGVLGDHNMKEEHVVYPGTDRALTPAESDALVARIQAL